MGSIPAESSTDAEPSVPEAYRRLEEQELRWTHADTGLEVALVRDRRPSAGRMTAGTASMGDDDCWIFEVRPDAHAEVYRRLDGDRRAALAYAREWMADHPDGRFGD